MERRDRGSSRPAPLGPLAQAEALDALGPDTVVRVRSQQRATLYVDGSNVTVGHAGGTVTFSPPYGDALHTVLHSRAGIRIGDIPGLSDEQRLELVGRLMRAGVVVADRTTPPGH
jgi:hypothetical protein